MKINKKVFIFDMDGTILNNENKINNKILIELQSLKDRGNLVIAASGRPFVDMISVQRYSNEIFDFMIANNGSYIYDVSKKAFDYDKKITREAVLKLLNWGIQNNTYFALHTNKGVVRVKLSNAIDTKHKDLEEFQKFQLSEIEKLYELINDKEIIMTQASLRSTKEIIKSAKHELSVEIIDHELSIAGEVYLDMNAIGTNKFYAIDKLMNKMNINIDDVIAFGDSGNDVEMLKNVGTGVAMGNGTKEAKENAKIIIGDNNSDAIYNFLKMFK